MKVLLVEDEASLADVLARNLRARGHDVVQAPSAELAVHALAESWPDALILDVNLPDRTGWDILRDVGPVDRDRLPTIVISAAPISPKRIDEFKPFRTLLKPFPIDALIRALNAITEREAHPDQRRP